MEPSQSEQPVSLDSAAGLLKRSRIPFALTCGMYDDKLMVDPTAEEEALMSSAVTVAVDVSGEVIGGVLLLSSLPHPHRENQASLVRMS